MFFEMKNKNNSSVFADEFIECVCVWGWHLKGYENKFSDLLVADMC